MFPKVLFAFHFVRTFPFRPSFLKLSKKVLCYALIWNLVCPSLSPAWAMFQDQEERGGTGIAATLPDVPHIPWRELQQGPLLGQGSFGNVYGGTWRGMEVAIKVLHLRELATPSVRQDFEEEVHALWTCQFPHVVRLYGVCTEPGHTAMIFERMAESLYDRLRRGDPISDERRLQIAIDMAKSLALLHERPVIHRDFKSHNVLLNTRERASISDFGSAKIRTATSTQTGQARGTVRWTAPELFGLHPRATAASDMYSYGMVLWELLTGRLPFATQANELIIMGAIKEGQREILPPGCPPLWKEIIEACWSQNPQARPPAQAVLAKFMAAKPPSRPLWLPQESPGPDYPLRAEGFVLYPASRGDWDHVLTCYHHHPVPGYDVGRVEVVFNPSMNARFEAQQRLLQQRHGNPRYLPTWGTEPDSQQRREILSLLDAAAEPYTDEDFSDVKHVPVWHGTGRGNLLSLLSAGYGAFCETDQGFFGVGIYAALEAIYAQMYADGFAPTPRGDGVLLLNWGMTHLSYPIVARDFNPTARCLRTRINPGRYDSHFVPVVPGDPTNPSIYVPLTPPMRRVFTEIVFGAATQILPRYLVTLQPTLPIEPRNQQLIMEASLREQEARAQALREQAQRAAEREAEARRQAQAQKEARRRAEQQEREAMTQRLGQLEQERDRERQERDTVVQQARGLQQERDRATQAQAALQQQVAALMERLRLAEAAAAGATGAGSGAVMATPAQEAPQALVAAAAATSAAPVPYKAYNLSFYKVSEDIERALGMDAQHEARRRHALWLKKGGNYVPKYQEPP